MADPGRFLLTFDFELGWGALESGLWRRRQADGVYRRLRDHLPRFLREVDALEIPCTWATVGGMLAAPGTHDLDHLPPALQQITRTALAEGEPASFDGRDLWEQVLATRVRHQIASHTYSHPRFDRDDMTAGVVREDMDRFHAIVAKDVPAIDRLVFPRNAEGYYDVLAGMGYKMVRALDDPRAAGLRGRLDMVLRPPPLAERRPASGAMSRLVGSLLFNPGYGQLHRMPTVYMIARRGLARAIATGGTLHLWLHPFNLAEIPGLQWALVHFLRAVARARDRGRLIADVF